MRTIVAVVAMSVCLSVCASRLLAVPIKMPSEMWTGFFRGPRKHIGLLGGRHGSSPCEGALFGVIGLHGSTWASPELPTFGIRNLIR